MQKKGLLNAVIWNIQEDEEARMRDVGINGEIQ